MNAVIFDLDGVLTYTDKYHYLAWKSIADSEGIYFDEEINKRLRGVSRRESFNIILERANKEYSEDEIAVLLDKKNKLYIEYLNELNEDSLALGARELLMNLKEKGFLLGVASSSKNTNIILEKTNLRSYFDAVVDGNMITNSKPDPEVFLKCADALHVDAIDAYIVEDAKAGILAGHNGGFKTIAVGDAINCEYADYKINELNDIIKIVDMKGEEKKVDNNKKPIISLEHIKKIYPNGVCAVKDFSLDIYEGEFVVFVGPSGCGKSTVLRMIAGLEEITDGSFYIDDVEMSDSEPKDRDIAMVFQNYALYPHKTVKQNIGFPLYMAPYGFKHFFDIKYRINRKKEIDRKVEEIAAKIGLTEYLDRRPKNLSGGQRQRVALGRAIIRNPKAFLLDEPLSNLDAKMRAEMRTEISKLHNELNTIFIYVTHDQIEAMTMASRIVVMKDGVIQQIGTPTEVFMHPVNMFVAGFIGTPQMNFIKVRVTNDGLMLPDNNIVTLPNNIKEKIDASYIGKEIILGIRPKAIYLDDASNICGNVSLCEQLGDEALIYFRYFSDHDYVASLATYKSFEPGSTIHLGLDLEYCSLFDIETEESIL